MIYSETFAQYIPRDEWRSALSREIAELERRIERLKTDETLMKKRKGGEKTRMLIYVLERRVQKMNAEMETA